MATAPLKTQKLLKHIANLLERTKVYFSFFLSRGLLKVLLSTGTRPLGLEVATQLIRKENHSIE